MTRKNIGAAMLAGALFALGAWAQAGEQQVKVADHLQIPGATLPAGTYSFHLEGRLPDRAIVKISSADQHYLVLAVPSAHLPRKSGNRLILFRRKGADNAEILRGWNCQECSAPLEFVYPKLEAVAITDETAQPVAAVDPEYDKLPAKLSADDMKVVTLWLLSPEHITAENVGQGVKAVKYVSEAGTPASSDQIASNRQAPARDRLPKTAGNGYGFVLAGFLLLGAGLAVRLRGASLSAH